MFKNAVSKYELYSNNIGLKDAKGEYAMIIQDDMKMIDFGYDRILLQPFMQFNDVLAVSGRCAHNTHIDGEYVKYSSFVGHCSYHNYVVHPTSTFEVRDSAIRGPLLLHMKKVRELGYLSEKFMPLAGDDHDVSEAHVSISSSDSIVAMFSRIYSEEVEMWYCPSIHLCSTTMVPSTKRRSSARRATECRQRS